MTSSVYHSRTPDQRRVDRLEQLLETLKTRYPEQHPLVRQVAENLEAARADLTASQGISDPEAA